MMITAVILAAIIFINYVPAASDWNKEQISKINETDEFCFYVISDIHNNVPAFDMFLNSLEKENSFVIVNGDFAHMGTNEEYNLALNMFKKIEMPTIVGIGNHEVASGNDLMFKRMFGPTYFSFEISENLFIIMDNSLENIDVDQYKWLKQELDKDVQRKFVVMHIPIFNPWKEDYNTQDASILSELFKEKNVTLVIASHEHRFQEFFFDDTRYVITGAIGGTTNESFSYIDVCINDDVSITKIEFGEQRQHQQEFNTGMFPIFIIFLKAILLAIVIYFTIPFLKKNFRFK